MGSSLTCKMAPTKEASQSSEAARIASGSSQCHSHDRSSCTSHHRSGHSSADRFPVSDQHRHVKTKPPRPPVDHEHRDRTAHSGAECPSSSSGLSSSVIPGGLNLCTEKRSRGHNHPHSQSNQKSVHGSSGGGNERHRNHGPYSDHDYLYMMAKLEGFNPHVKGVISGTKGSGNRYSHGYSAFKPSSTFTPMSATVPVHYQIPPCHPHSIPVTPCRQRSVQTTSTDTRHSAPFVPSSQGRQRMMVDAMVQTERIIDWKGVKEDMGNQSAHSSYVYKRKPRERKQQKRKRNSQGVKGAMREDSQGAKGVKNASGTLTQSSFTWSVTDSDSDSSTRNDSNCPVSSCAVSKAPVNLDLSQYYIVEKLQLPCERCDGIFENGIDLYSHTPCSFSPSVVSGCIQRGDSRYICRFPFCGKKWITKSSLRNHLQSHFPQVYQCVICEYNPFTSPYEDCMDQHVERHLASHFCQSSNVSKKGKDSNVSKKAKSSKNATFTAPQLPSKCRDCGDIFGTRKELFIHKKNFHGFIMPGGHRPKILIIKSEPMDEDEEESDHRQDQNSNQGQNSTPSPRKRGRPPGWKPKPLSQEVIQHVAETVEAVISGKLGPPIKDGDELVTQAALVGWRPRSGRRGQGQETGQGQSSGDIFPTFGHVGTMDTNGHQEQEPVAVSQRWEPYNGPFCTIGRISQEVSASHNFLGRAISEGHESIKSHNFSEGLESIKSRNFLGRAISEGLESINEPLELINQPVVEEVVGTRHQVEANSEGSFRNYTDLDHPVSVNKENYNTVPDDCYDSIPNDDYSNTVPDDHDYLASIQLPRIDLRRIEEVDSSPTFYTSSPSSSSSDDSVRFEVDRKTGRRINNRSN